MSEAYTHADMRFTQPPQAGVAPSHRRFRERHSSHAREARLRTDFLLEDGDGGLGPFCALRLEGVSVVIMAGVEEGAEEAERKAQTSSLEHAEHIG